MRLISDNYNGGVKMKEWSELYGAEKLYRARRLKDNLWREFNEFHLMMGNIDTGNNVIEILGEKYIFTSFQKLKESNENTEKVSKFNPVEKSRTYTYPKGEKIVLENVKELKIGYNGNHILKTSDSKIQIISTGWLCIEIDADEPNSQQSVYK